MSRIILTRIHLFICMFSRVQRVNIGFITGDIAYSKDTTLFKLLQVLNAARVNSRQASCLTKGTQTLQEIWNQVQIESEEFTIRSGVFGLQSKIRFLKILNNGIHNPVLDYGIQIWIVQKECTLKKPMELIQN